MITIFQKFKNFWQIFWEAIQTAYNKAFKSPMKTQAQQWQDITKINFLDIFVTKLSNLVNTEATFDIESDSGLVERLKTLCKSLESRRSHITEHMLGDGDFYIFPAHNTRGEIVHTYLTQQQVRIVAMDGEEIIEACGLIDWLVDNNNRVFYLLRRHKLTPDGTLVITYQSVNDQGKHTSVAQWDYIDGHEFRYGNAKHIGFGRYKSPASSRGLSPIYGVPLNFGCDEIEKRIFEDLKQIDDEFRLGKSKIFTDPRNLLKDEEKKEYKLAENIIPVKSRSGQQSGPNIDIFNPTLRHSEHYAKLVSDMAMLEKEIGTSKGILTDNETAYTATATAVKRANKDTIALINQIRAALDAGNEMTLRADAVYLNVAQDLWSYRSDWYDPFEDPDEQWRRLVEAKNNGAADATDLIKWQWPNLDEDEVMEKIERIKEEAQSEANSALDRMFAGE